MKYYESDDPKKQIEEALEKLRAHVGRLYVVGEPDSRVNKDKMKQYQENHRKISLATGIYGTKNSGVMQRFLPQASYNLPEIARKIENLLIENQGILDEDYRVDFGKWIIKIVDPEVAVEALEMLLRYPHGCIVPPFPDKDFENGFYKKSDLVRRGIRILYTSDKACYSQLSYRCGKIYDSFVTAYNNHRDIFNVRYRVEDNPRFIGNYESIGKMMSSDCYFLEMMKSANQDMEKCLELVLSELKKQGILEDDLYTKPELLMRKFESFLGKLTRSAELKASEEDSGEKDNTLYRKTRTGVGEFKEQYHPRHFSANPSVPEKNGETEVPAKHFPNDSEISH